MPRCVCPTNCEVFAYNTDFTRLIVPDLTTVFKPIAPICHCVYYACCMNKTVNVRVRLTEPEAKFVKDQATLAGMNISEYLRQLAAGHTVQERLPLDVRCDLQGIGASLSQLTAFAHKGLLREQSIYETLDKLKKILQ